MKSFEAKLYIEDNLATIEFDVMMKGEYDEDYTPGWNFGIIENKWMAGERLSQTAPRTHLAFPSTTSQETVMIFLWLDSLPESIPLLLLLPLLDPCYCL